MTDQPETKLEATIDGKTYSLDFADFTGLEARLFRQAVGVSMLSAAELVEKGELDGLEMLGAIKWLVDRRDDPALSYEDVLEGLTYNSISEVGDGDPPPRGGRSSGASPPSRSTSASGRGKSTS